MRLTWMAAVIAVAVLILSGPGLILGQSATAFSSGQTPKKSASQKSAALTL